VNISAPVGVSVTSVGTNTLNESFVFGGQIISWSNSSGLIFNGTTGDFWMNASMNQTGSFNITVTTLDTSSNTNSTNLTVTISDTTPPSISFVVPTPPNNSILDQSYLPVNVTASDNAGIENISIVLLYNHSSTVINASFNPSSPFFLNFTGLPNGNYSIGATANDTSGNINNTNYRYLTLNFTNSSSVPTVSCTENWTCSSWGTCSNLTKTQSCLTLVDSNNCNTTANKPLSLTQECTPSCSANWVCGNWTPDPCVSDQTQTRTCNDSNGCEQPKNYTRSCSSANSSSLNSQNQVKKTQNSSVSTAFIVIVVLIVISIVTVVVILMRLKNKSYSSSEDTDFGNQSELGRPKTY